MTAAPVRARSQPKRPPRRWAGVLLALCALVGLAVGGYFATRPSDYTVLHFHGEAVRVPKVRLSPLRNRIVAIAESQLGYVTDPPSTYCNKYSAYWVSGADDCGNSNLDEQWCADFAAWVWERAGADVTYQYVNGDLTGFSVVELATDEVVADTHPGSALLSGYVAPS